MTQENNLRTDSIHSSSLAVRMLQGAGIALILIAIFLLNAGEPNPEWGKFWMVKPLIMVPLAGATGGVFFYLLDKLRYKGGWRMVLANLLSLVIYTIGLWMGTVLGLNGTMWD